MKNDDLNAIINKAGAKWTAGGLVSIQNSYPGWKLVLGWRLKEKRK